MVAYREKFLQDFRYLLWHPFCCCQYHELFKREQRMYTVLLVSPLEPCYIIFSSLNNMKVTKKAYRTSTMPFQTLYYKYQYSHYTYTNRADSYGAASVSLTTLFNLVGILITNHLKVTRIPTELPLSPFEPYICCVSNLCYPQISEELLTGVPLSPLAPFDRR
jgi:hypothetical protein